MKLYLDAKKTQEIKENEVVQLEAEVEQNNLFKIYLYNDSTGTDDKISVEIKLLEENDEVKVTKIPERIKSEELDEVIFETKPTLEIKKAIKISLEVFYRRIYS